jgi:hypothetical protein
MNTHKFSTKMYIALSLLMLLTLGLVGCKSIEVGAVEADSDAGDTEEVTAIEIGIEPTPMPEMLSYQNDYYGFKFNYPETWTLTEEDQRIVLKKGTNRLGITFHWVNEELNPDLRRTGMAAGTPIYSGKVNFMGQVLPEYIVELEHKAKFVLYGDPTRIEIGDLVFGIVLEDLDTDYMELELPDELIADAKTILETFESIEATGSNPSVAPTQEPTPTAPVVPTMEMSVYSNLEYGFTFSYPSYMTVVEEPNKVYINDKGKCQMTIAYKRAEEDVQITDVGDVTGQLVNYNEVIFLGSTHVQSFLEIQDQLIKAAFLGEPGVELGEGTPLRFVVSMANTEGGRLANGQVDAMLQIFENFGLTK